MVALDPGAGFNWLFGEFNSWGIDFDEYYILTSSIHTRIEEIREKYNSAISNEAILKFSFTLGVIWTF